MTLAIEVTDLHKTYVDFEAVKGVDLDVNDGEIFAFLGPNGAGKTTTIEILEGFRAATAGSVRVLGQDPSTAPLSWKEEIGIVLQESEVEPELTPREAIRMFAAYYRAPRPVDEVIEIVGLQEKADDRIGKLSGGQKRRVDLALALIGDPKLVFLDEPTTGFDPSARRDSWEMIENLRALGRTVLLTTHYMDEAQQLADRIAVIAAGKIVARGTAKELGEQVKAIPRISWIGTAAEGLSVPFVQEGERLVVEAEEQDVIGTVQAVTGWATEAGADLPGFEVIRPSLEDTYLRLVAE